MSLPARRRLHGITYHTHAAHALPSNQDMEGYPDAPVAFPYHGASPPDWTCSPPPPPPGLPKAQALLGPPCKPLWSWTRYCLWKYQHPVLSAQNFMRIRNRWQRNGLQGILGEYVTELVAVHVRVPVGIVVSVAVGNAVTVGSKVAVGIGVEVPSGVRVNVGVHVAST